MKQSHPPLQPLLIEHLFYYGTKGEITATMLAESLTGLDGIVKQAARVFGIMADIKVKDAEVLIEGIEFGSYKENFFVRLIFGKGKKQEANLEKLRVSLRLDKLDFKRAISILIGGIILWGVYDYATKKGDAQAILHIENSFNNWAPELGMSKEELMGMIQGSVKNKEELKRNVMRLAKPDGSNEVADLRLDDGSVVSIPKQVLEALPEKYAKPEEETPPLNLERVQIIVRATDLARTPRLPF